jgi:hypothetical protein
MDAIQDKPKLRILFKNSIKETCASTTMHAIPNILRESSHLILKIIWIICFVICSGLCLYFIIDAFQNFLAYPVVINRSIVQEIPSQFPKVSFCNNKFTNISINISQYLNISPLREKATYDNNTNIFKSLYEWDVSSNYLIKAIFNSPNFSKPFRKLVGYQIEDMLISCYFNYKPCYSTDFTYFYSEMYGNCYTFNGGVDGNGTTLPIKTVSSNGLFYGLTLELFIGNPYNNWLTTQDGILLSIQNQTSASFLQDKILKASSGAETDFIIKRNLVTRLPPPHGNCLSDKAVSKYYDYIVNTLNSVYSGELCLQICLQDLVLSACDCLNGYLPRYGNSSNTFCGDSWKSIYCMTNLTNQGSSECQIQCPPECISSEYDLTITRATYPTYYYYTNFLANYILKKGINSSVPEAFTKVNIYYEKMEFTEIVENKKFELADLMSNLGFYFFILTLFE